MKKKSVAIVLMLSAVSATAQTTHAPPKPAPAPTAKPATPAPAPTAPVAPLWAQEPTSFIGVKLGRPLSESMPECAKVIEHGFPTYADRDSSKTLPPCYQEGIFKKLIDVPVLYEAWASTVNGNVEYVNGRLCILCLDGMLPALTERYGPPHYTQVEDVQSKAGVHYENHVYLWMGKNVTIKFETLGSKVDHGEITVTTKAFDDDAKARAEKNKKALVTVF